MGIGKDIKEFASSNASGSKKNLKTFAREMGFSIPRKKKKKTKKIEI